MNWLRSAWVELFGLFVDNGRFAIAILVWVALAWLTFPHLLPPGWDAIALAVGLIVILIVSTTVSPTKRSSPSEP